MAEPAMSLQELILMLAYARDFEELQVALERRINLAEAELRLYEKLQAEEKQQNG